MSQDIIHSPSRRTIAKGAAWAIPAVSVAAAAPSLAASPDSCDPGTLTVTPNCPPLITLPQPNSQQLTFTIANPAESDCTVPAGTLFTVDRGGLGEVQVGPLNDLNASVDVLFDTENTGQLTAPLAPGESVTIQIFPRDLVNVALLQQATVSIEGSSATQGYTILSVLGISVALCGGLG